MEISAINPSAVLGAPTQDPAINHQARQETRELVKAVKHINEVEFFGERNELTFVLDRETHRPLLRVIDKETKEVIMQLPPEQVLRQAKNLD